MHLELLFPQEVVRRFIRSTIQQKHELSAYASIAAFVKEVNDGDSMRLGLEDDGAISEWAKAHESEVRRISIFDNINSIISFTFLLDQQYLHESEKRRGDGSAQRLPSQTQADESICDAQRCTVYS